MRVVEILVGLRERGLVEGLWSVKVLVEVMGRRATFTKWAFCLGCSLGSGVFVIFFMGFWRGSTRAGGMFGEIFSLSP